MAALETAIHSLQEFGVAIVAETTVGTNPGTTMQRLNVDGLVGLTLPLVQAIEPRSGESRVQDKKHIFVTDYGTGPYTVQVPLVLDTTVDNILHENVMGATEAATTPASVDLVYNYLPAAYANATGSISDNLHTLTVALISPVTGETIYLTGACVTELSVSVDSGTDGGRRHATATFSTFHRPADAGTAPTTPTDYGTTYRYLRDLTALKTVAGDAVVINKLEYTISNPLNAAGSNSSGNPEILTRAVTPNKVTATGIIGVKYDANTAEHWQTRRAGTTIELVFANFATWASASNTYGLMCEQALITDVSDAATDMGVFRDISVEFMADVANTKDVLVLAL